MKLDNLVNILFDNWPKRVFWGGLEMTYGEDKPDLLQLWSANSKNYDDIASGIKNGVSYISGKGDAVNVGFHHKGTYGIDFTCRGALIYSEILNIQEICM